MKRTGFMNDKYGGVAQLGERVLRMYEVRGSIPLISTNGLRMIVARFIII